MSKTDFGESREGIGGLTFTEGKQPKKKTDKTFLWFLWFIISIATIALGIWLIFKSVTSGNLPGRTPELVRQVEAAGFNEVNYYASNSDMKTAESATAKYGSCQVTFKLTTRQVEDGSSIVALALVQSDDKFLFDPTPAKLAALTEYGPCGGS